MSDGSETRPLTKCFGLYLLKQGRSHRLIRVMDLFKSCLKRLKQYRTIEQMCSDAHSITLVHISIKSSSFYLNVSCAICLKE